MKKDQNDKDRSKKNTRWWSKTFMKNCNKQRSSAYKPREHHKDAKKKNWNKQSVDTKNLRRSRDEQKHIKSTEVKQIVADWCHKVLYICNKQQRIVRELLLIIVKDVVMEDQD